MEFKGIGEEWDLSELNISDMKQITIFCSNPKQVIAHVYLPDYEITPKLQANAKLISKAPEMLKMLIKFNNINSIAREHINEDLFEDLAKLIKEATTI